MSEVAVGSASSAAADHAKTATIERYFAAILAGDDVALDEVLTPDAVTRWPQSGERIVGAGAASRCMRTTRADRRRFTSNGSRAKELPGLPSRASTMALIAGTS